MRTIKPQNQVWCATHSAELIDEAGRERTFYLRSSPDRMHAECIPATDETAEIEALRDLFGYSGYVGISRRVVFSEGKESSADRRTFANVLPAKSHEVKIIPVGSVENLYRINRAILALLESGFARCEFYLIRDRDYLSQASVDKHRAIAPNRLFVLSRYHIENYLLDENLIATVLRDIYHIGRTPQEVREELFNYARDNSAGFLRDMVAFRFGELFQAEDCSIGNHSQNQNLLDSNGNLDGGVLDPLRTALFRKVTDVNTQLINRINDNEKGAIFDSCVDQLKSALCVDTEDWKSLFPGRYLLQRFANVYNLGKWPALQNVLIDRLSRGDIQVHSELKQILDAITRT